MELCRLSGVYCLSSFALLIGAIGQLVRMQIDIGYSFFSYLVMAYLLIPWFAVFIAVFTNVSIYTKSQFRKALVFAMATYIFNSVFAVVVGSAVNYSGFGSESAIASYVMISIGLLPFYFYIRTYIRFGK